MAGLAHVYSWSVASAAGPRRQRLGAVIAARQIVVDGNNIKKVQHPTGGIVGEIRVKNGDHVQAGQIVIRLDDTQTRAALGIIASQLIESRAAKRGSRPSGTMRRP